MNDRIIHKVIYIYYVMNNMGAKPVHLQRMYSYTLGRRTPGVLCFIFICGDSDVHELIPVGQCCKKECNSSQDEHMAIIIMYRARKCDRVNCC